MSCPICEREWIPNTEQSICIELFNQCMVCMFMNNGPGTKKQLDNIMDVYHERMRWTMLMAKIDEDVYKALLPQEFYDLFHGKLFNILVK